MTDDEKIEVIKDFFESYLYDRTSFVTELIAKLSDGDDTLYDEFIDSDGNEAITKEYFTNIAQNITWDVVINEDV